MNISEAQKITKRANNKLNKVLNNYINNIYPELIDKVILEIEGLIKEEAKKAVSVAFMKLKQIIFLQPF